MSLEKIHGESIVHTKMKIHQDIESFFEQQQDIPTFEEYIRSRGHYLDQIWVNVWLTRVSNQVPRVDKKEFLQELGIDTEGMARKLIDHLFRTEVRDYEPFKVTDWLEETYGQEYEKWNDLYKLTMEQVQKREEASQKLIKRESVLEAIKDKASEVFSSGYNSLYLYIRYLVGLQMKADIQSKPRYKRLDTYALEEKLEIEGSLEEMGEQSFSSFLDELTGDIQKTNYDGRFYYEYETYGDLYSSFIWKNLLGLAPSKVLTNLDDDTKSDFTQLTGQALSKSKIKELVEDELESLFSKMISELEEEYIDHLLHAVETPYDLDFHKKLYEEQKTERQKRKVEEEAERRRKIEEEERMMDDIFGREYGVIYDPSVEYIIHVGETNTGKTYHALERMKRASSGLYLGPLRLLALEVYDKLNADGIPCSLKTGEEEKLTPGATHIASTVEMFHEKDRYDVIVIDEAQMITDKDRGFSWFKAITKARAREVHIIGSRNSKNMILQLLGESKTEIHEYKRDIPLEVEGNEFSIKQVRKGDALICFSRRRVLETASRLQNDRHSVSVIYGSMPPETRKKQIQQFIEGKSKVIVSTDAIGMGLNLPIRRIVFLENEKFDGTRRRLLTSQEIKQIAGRAGRKGIYDVGKVAFTKDIRLMRRRLEQEDEPVHTFAIAPTTGVLERFQTYYRDLGTFFELWDRFKNPRGTEKASLAEERELYEIVKGTEIEARLSLQDLYGFLHLPFASREQALIQQWYETIFAIINNEDLPEPFIKKRTLEDLELSYKKLGLHLLFLYRLDRRTEAIYWERVRNELSDEVHEKLQTDVGSFAKRCRVCGRHLPWNYDFPICDHCHAARHKRS
ncbi:helicase-related protein [Robertmurraya korlensis]|uniref:helicase-related protein n=1 Tax=Robertmurraya korlensis TaxID=519977 RepID=UPI00082682EA|nr:helicase-related protein [Robertmurraya korlensis]